LEKRLVRLGGVTVDERGFSEERRGPIRMAGAEPAQDIRLKDREAFVGPVLQVLLDFLAVKPLKDQPGRIAEVEERFAGLIDEVATIGADLQLHSLDGTVGAKEG